MEKRRLRGDLIETFKIFNGLTNIDLDDLLILNQNGLRNNGLKLKKDNYNKNNYKGYFNNRVVDGWNALPRDVVDSPSLTVFKKRLDGVMQEML